MHYQARSLLMFMTLTVSIGCFYAGRNNDSSDESGDGTVGDGDGDPSSGDGDGDPTTAETDDETDTLDTETSGTDDSTGDGDGDGDCVGTGDYGDECLSDCDCASSRCYISSFFGGQCGECKQDADCPNGGCSPPNPLANDGSSCNAGELGAGCESNAVCEDGLTCTTPLSLDGVFEISTCGECESSVQCPNGICAPLFDVELFTGVHACITPGSLPKGSYCELQGNGDQACASGYCAPVDVLGIAQIGACGECKVNLHCNGGTCEPGQLMLEMGTLTGSTCN